MIAIIDYGRGNLTSVSNAFAKIGVDAVVTSDKRNIAAADAVVLPGVGEFSDAMGTLSAGKLDQAIHGAISAGKPFLGICLGYQMLFEYSEEGGNRLPGLGIFKGAVRRFPDTDEMKGLKIPHMGWNRIEYADPTADRSAGRMISGLLAGLPVSGAFMYFVHSYYPVPADRSIAAAETDYGIRFVSAVSSGNIHGTQFHPEKSGEAGLTILRNFAGGLRC